MIGPQTLLFFLPLDLIRIYWIITPADIAALLYCLRFLFKGRIQKGVFVTTLLVVAPFIMLALISALTNQSYAGENIFLIVGTVLSAVKAIAFIDALDRSWPECQKPIVVSFILVNICLGLGYVLGVGLTGSGRLSGFFGSSNGMAAFQTFAVAAAFMAMRSVSVLPWILIGFSSILILLSGSRGSLLAVVVLTLCYIGHLLLSSRLIAKLVAALIILPPTAWIVMEPNILNHLGLVLSESSNNGMQRIGHFILSTTAGSALEEYQSARGDLNSIAVDFILSSFTLFGFGYESSLRLLGAGLRVHNIFLIAMIEFGFVGLLYFSSLFACSLFMTLRSVRGGGVNLFISLLFICVMSQALKTPYYFLNGISWMVLIFFVREALRTPLLRRDRSTHSVVDL